MIAADGEKLCADLRAVAPVAVRFHGSPRNAPSPEPRGCGYIAFRSLGCAFVEVAPERPPSPAEASALSDAMSPWMQDAGITYHGGPDGWPFAEEK